ncbi:hypothetical protein DNTS_009426 [Danionella cerebrum]|uniref:AF4/FMR2 family member lilli n=1 Tax=Danionella cerebrum TaxID=2873325 RepID=A0A553NID1_9TELE|nr:hypothetical protein DNTS_009426 [Danionella translucida]
MIVCSGTVHGGESEPSTSQEIQPEEAPYDTLAPLFGQPFKRVKADALASRIQMMLGDYEDGSVADRCAATLPPALSAVASGPAPEAWGRFAVLLGPADPLSPLHSSDSAGDGSPEGRRVPPLGLKRPNAQKPTAYVRPMDGPEIPRPPQDLKESSQASQDQKESTPALQHLQEARESCPDSPLLQDLKENFQKALLQPLQEPGANRTPRSPKHLQDLKESTQEESGPLQDLEENVPLQEFVVEVVDEARDVLQVSALLTLWDGFLLKPPSDPVRGVQEMSSWPRLLSSIHSPRTFSSPEGSPGVVTRQAHGPSASVPPAPLSRVQSSEKCSGCGKMQGKFVASVCDGFETAVRAEEQHASLVLRLLSRPRNPFSSCSSDDSSDSDSEASGSPGPPASPEQTHTGQSPWSPYGIHSPVSPDRPRSTTDTHQISEMTRTNTTQNTRGLVEKRTTGTSDAPLKPDLKHSEHRDTKLLSSLKSTGIRHSAMKASDAEEKHSERKHSEQTEVMMEVTDSKMKPSHLKLSESEIPDVEHSDLKVMNSRVKRSDPKYHKKKLSELSSSTHSDEELSETEHSDFTLKRCDSASKHREVKHTALKLTLQNPKMKSSKALSLRVDNEEHSNANLPHTGAELPDTKVKHSDSKRSVRCSKVKDFDSKHLKCKEKPTHTQPSDAKPSRLLVKIPLKLLSRTAPEPARSGQPSSQKRSKPSKKKQNPGKEGNSARDGQPECSKKIEPSMKKSATFQLSFKEAPENLVKKVKIKMEGSGKEKKRKTDDSRKEKNQKTQDSGKEKKRKTDDVGKLETQRSSETRGQKTSKSRNEPKNPKPSAKRAGDVVALQQRQGSVEDHLREAKRLKHQADAMLDRSAKALLYLESALEFVESGVAMELKPESQTHRSAFTMFSETLELIRFILRLKDYTESSATAHDRDFFILCLQVQALLQMFMFRFQRESALGYSQTLMQHFRGSSYAPSPSANSSSGVAVPRCVQQMTLSYLSITALFLNAQENWEQVERLTESGSGLKLELDAAVGSLSLSSSITSLIVYARLGLQRLQQKTRAEDQPAIPDSRCVRIGRSSTLISLTAQRHWI